jgi:replicative DNA helicase
VIELSLYNDNLAAMLLGASMKQPSLLTLPQYPLVSSDFSPNKMHQILFVCINRLAHECVQEVTELEIENVAKARPDLLEVLQDNNYFDFVYTAKELSVLGNFEYYYNTIRKYSLLREMQANGLSITEFYDELGDEEEQQGKFDKLTIQDILSKTEIKSIRLRSKYDIKYTRDEIIVGEDIDSLLEDFKNRPSFGAFLCSPYLTQLIHGFSRGNLIMRSAPSGTNKTRIAVADLCGLCVDKYWDFDKQDFVENPNYQGNGFFIHTELDTRREMQPMFLGCVAGVPSNTITMGRCTQEEEKRVKKAAEILQKCNFHLIDMPDFTSASLERKIKECVEQSGSVYGCFDYMMLNGPLSMEYKQNTGVQAREDMALRGLATDLKSYCEKYNIGLLTMSQTNGNENSTEFPDESCIAGSKAMRNKIDAGFIMIPAKLRPKEMKIVEPFVHKKGFGNQLKPNRITYIYKARFGEYSDQKIKIFHHFDPATMRNTDFFCTDGYNQYLSIPKPMLEASDDEE